MVHLEPDNGSRAATRDGTLTRRRVVKREDRHEQRSSLESQADKPVAAWPSKDHAVRARLADEALCFSARQEIERATGLPKHAQSRGPPRIDVSHPQEQLQ